MKHGEKMYHIHCRREDVGRYVLVPGDPGRVEKIAAALDDPFFVATNREHTVWNGRLAGELVTVCSTGMGGPSTAIAVEELIKCGADTFIRVGTAGGMQPDIEIGTLALVSAAIRDEGTGLQYLPVEFPAVADPVVLFFMREAARELGIAHRVGIAQSKDSFYGQHEPERMPLADTLKQRWLCWRAGGAICSEMEAATLFILGSTYGKRTGGVMVIAGNQERERETGEKEVLHPGPERAIKVAVLTLRKLILADQA